MSNITEEVLFPTAGLNTDDSWEYIANGDAPYRLHIIQGEEGVNGVITNMKGNHLASYPLSLANVYIVLGSHYNITTRKCYYFVFSQPYDWSGSDDYIYDNHLLCFNEDTEEITNIFTDEVNYFGLHYDYPVRDCDMLGDYLYFNPRISEPKMIDVVRAYNYTFYDEYDPLSAYVYADKVKFHGGVFMANDDVSAGQTPSTHTDYWDRIGDSYQDFVSWVFDSEFRYAFNVLRLPAVNSPLCIYDYDDTNHSNNVRGLVFRFAVRYEYFDNTHSVYSAYSDLILPNYSEYYNGETEVTASNFIHINIDLPSAALVREIEIVFQESGHDWKRAKIINRLEQDLLDETMYVFDFYNNESYPVIDQDEILKIYDAVPRWAQAQELINKNVLTYAGCTEGFNNINKNEIDVVLEPELLSFEIPEAAGYMARDMINSRDVTYDSRWEVAGRTGTWVYSIVLDFAWYDSVTVEEDDIFNLYITTDSQRGLTGLQEHSYTIQLADVVSIDAFVNAISDFISDAYPDFTITIDTINHTLTLEYTSRPKVIEVCRVYTPAVAGDVVLYKRGGFKTGAWHPFCIYYYDGALRRGDAQTARASETESGLAMNGTTVFVPMFNDVSPNPLTTNNRWIINWEIYHAPPSWAKYWRWGYAGNTLCSWFVQYVIAGIEDEASDPRGSTRIDITPLQELQTSTILGNQFPNSAISPYQWAEGDRVRIITEEAWLGEIGAIINGVYDFEIIKQDVDNNYIYTTQFPHATLQIGSGSIIEIYSPLKGNTATVYYEFGGIYPVIEDDNGNLSHRGAITDQDIVLNTPASGVFDMGDVYHILRTPSLAIDGTDSYFHESQWYSDFYESNDWGKGKPGVETTFKQKRLNIIRYSNQYLQDTEINGLSTFGGNNYKEVTDIYGDIRAIVEVGTTLKVYMQKKSASISIGRQEWLDADGTPTLSTSAVVLGAVRYPENNIGTEWLESVFKNNRYVYGFDIYNAVMWRDSANGLFPISGRYADAEGGSGDYKMSSWFKEKSRELMQSGIENVRVLTTWDEKYKLLYVTFSDRVDATHNDTIVFHEPSNRWITFAELEQTPLLDGWNEILELSYEVVYGFESGLDIYFDEDTRFAFFSIGGGLGTTSDVKVFPGLQEMTLDILEPTIQIDSSPPADLLSMSLQLLEPVAYVSYTYLSETDMDWEPGEYGTSVQKSAIVTSSETQALVTSLPSWLRVVRETLHILSVGYPVYNASIYYFYPIAANTGGDKLGSFTIQDAYGNQASITAWHKAAPQAPVVNFVVGTAEIFILSNEYYIANIGSSSLYISFDHDFEGNSNKYLLVTDASSNVLYSGSDASGIRVRLAHTSSKTVTLSRALVSGDILTVQIGLNS